MKTHLKFSQLDKKKSIFFQIGLIVALTLVLFAFEWQTSILDYTNIASAGNGVLIDDIAPIVRLEPKTKPPLPKTQQIKIVKDTEKEETAHINSEADQNTIVSNTVPDIAPEKEPELEVDEVLPSYNVSVQPLFDGGFEGLYTYISKNIEYPKSARINGTEGTVHIGFIIEKDGSVSNVELLRGIGDGCDEEVLRVIKQMPKWKPGMQLDKPVRVQFRIPVKLTLMH